jgi:hypothetical protein
MEMIYVDMMELALDPLMRPSDIFLQPISIVKPSRCTISQIYFILEQQSTCFRQSLCPSSGVCHTGSVAAC